ncbi:hypothetical protein SMI01S_36350 [Sphingobacterium mizutaii NBRC 14946 = DSM 11724]|uniref:Uncharacterized protein n=1 Tax=Sphingobacterium mizutaii NBRC 14946 = DSM 11724 TaxID=1220576 RepID=A0ABQ0W812_9SPHI|nr:hypothetical protein SMI01S_36350 [Sphingobacterium mizutaii NBRC 14946 = DSM 11724]
MASRGADFGRPRGAKEPGNAKAYGGGIIQLIDSADFLQVTAFIGPGKSAKELYGKPFKTIVLCIQSVAGKQMYYYNK